MRELIRIIFLLVFLLGYCGCVSTVSKEQIEKENVFRNKIREAGYSYSSNGFNQAAEDGKVDVLKLYKEGGFDINKYSIALLYAINKNQLESVNCLLSLGANPNFNNYAGNPLGFAIKKGSKEIVKSLLKKGAKVNLISVQDSETPLFKCALYGDKDIAKILIDNGADIDYVNAVTNDSILIIASKSGNLGVAELLLEKGVNLNFEDMNGYTALDWAIFNRKMNIAENLIRYDASLYNKDGNCRVGIMEALKNGEFDIISCMIQSGFNVNSKTPNGIPLIVWCSKMDLNDAVEFLEKNKADINVAAPNGMTAIDYAMNNKNKETKRIQQSINSRLKEVDSYTLEQFKEENNIEDY